MLTKKMKAGIIAGCALTAGIAFSVVACDMRMTTATYRLSTGKLQTPIRIVFISDLHNSLFGKGQSELINEVEKAAPDIIVIGGRSCEFGESYLSEVIKQTEMYAHIPTKIVLFSNIKIL